MPTITIPTEMARASAEVAPRLALMWSNPVCGFRKRVTLESGFLSLSRQFLSSAVLKSQC